ncbi:GntR family transcriptional regulator [Curtobacterium aetherium]|uniref:GntR family transcriptional regulator n=1 Tax=Curtobacterium aetherium TaxID=2841594 RepID=A0ACD1E3L2_9MICO|nr:GntR family transcriptional regulator [Curtobacterium sp. L6-1]QWS33272.1 GntR family transcriptional regulator [Curtobacterium sp. L6-1]
MRTVSGTSKYVAVREHLLSRILQMEAGTRLPPEPVLCDEYGVSRITLRHAVDGLIADGHLVREQGRGTFVTEPQFRTHYRERFADSVKGFHAQQTEEGFRVTSQVLRQQVITAGERVATELDVNPADRVVELVRLRYVNGALHQLAFTWLPFDRFPATATADFSTASLYGFLRDEYDLTLERNDLLVSIAAADSFTADALLVERGDRLLRVASTVYDQDDRAVATGTSDFTPQNSELFFGLHG